MKIGIITLPLKYNYGGLLQNFALQVVLRRLGHEAITLDVPYKSKRSLKNSFFLLLKVLKDFLIFSNGKILGFWKRTSSSQILAQNTRNFIDNFICIKKFEDFKEGDYDALIVGSDQVWRPMYADLDVSFLDFAKKWDNIKRIAYASSFGSDVWEYTDSQTVKYSLLAKLFDAVSVREKSGCDLCQYYLGVSATHVLDPTMLLKSEDYVKILNIKRFSPSEGSLFYYFLDTNISKDNFVNLCSKVLAIKPFTVNSRVEDSSAPLELRIQPPVEKWVKAFYDAEFVVTDSFHGTVFSILFNKPFIVLGNNKRGLARFESLLSMFDLTSRLYDINDVDKIDINKMKTRPNANVGDFRTQSINFLRKYLRNA